MITSANPDLERWNHKYRSGNSELIYPKGESELAQLPRVDGKELAIEIACGRGANALYLATLGYDVVAVDGAIEGLRSCARSAVHFDLPVFPVVMDLQVAALPANRFHLISVVRYLQRSLVCQLIEALRPNGVIFFKTFNRRFLSERPDFNPDYVLRDGELLEIFNKLDVIAASSEDETRSSSFIIARKPL